MPRLGTVLFYIQICCNHPKSVSLHHKYLAWLFFLACGIKDNILFPCWGGGALSTLLLLEECKVPWHFSISQNMLMLLALLRDYYPEVYTWYYNA